MTEFISAFWTAIILTNYDTWYTYAAGYVAAYIFFYPTLVTFMDSRLGTNMMCNLGSHENVAIFDFKTGNTSSNYVKCVRCKKYTKLKL